MTTKLFAMFVLITAIAGDDATDGKASVTLVEIREVRFKNLGPSRAKARVGIRDPARVPHLAVILEIAGPPAAQAIKYGHIKIIKAEDDQGKSLKAIKVSDLTKDPADGFIDIDRHAMFFWDQDKPTDKLRVELNLENAGRSAKTLKKLEGTIKLRIAAERQEVVIDAILSKQGQTIEHEVLKAAGLTLTVVEVDPKTKRITFETTGVQDSLLSMTLETADGKAIDAAQFSTPAPNAVDAKMSRGLNPWAAVPPDARLRLIIGTGLSTVDVPFSFADVALP